MRETANPAALAARPLQDGMARRDDVRRLTWADCEAQSRDVMLSDRATSRGQAHADRSRGTMTRRNYAVASCGVVLSPHSGVGFLDQFRHQLHEPRIAVVIGDDPAVFDGRAVLIECIETGHEHQFVDA